MKTKLQIIALLASAVVPALLACGVDVASDDVGADTKHETFEEWKEDNLIRVTCRSGLLVVNSQYTSSESTPAITLVADCEQAMDALKDGNDAGIDARLPGPYHE